VQLVHVGVAFERVSQFLVEQIVNDLDVRVCLCVRGGGVLRLGSERRKGENASLAQRGQGCAD
jgi:hypothetical protein